MKIYSIVALILIAAGVFALIYGGFSYTKSSDEVNLGPIEFTVTEKERVNVPVWAGAFGAIVAGAALLAFPVLRGA